MKNTIGEWLTCLLEGLLATLATSNSGVSGLDLASRGLPLAYKIGRWGMGMSWQFAPIAFFIDWLIFLIFFLIVDLVLTKIKKVKINILIRVAIVGFLLFKTIPSLWSEAKAAITCPDFTTTNESRIASESLKKADKSVLYRIYDGQRYYMNRVIDRCGVHFISSDGDRGYISTGLVANFVPGTPKEITEEIFSKESLAGVKAAWPGSSETLYYLKTTERSKFQDGLQESNYLAEKYKIIEFAEADMMSVSGNENLFLLITDYFSNLDKSGNEIRIDPEATAPTVATESKVTKSFYVPGYGLVEETKTRKFIKKWMILYDLSPQTIKEVIKTYMDHNQVPDLKLNDYVMVKVDHEGRAEEYMLYFYSEKLDKMYMFIVDDRGEIMDTEDKDYNPGRSSHETVDWTRLRNSDELVREAESQKGKCSGKLELMMTAASVPQVSVTCPDDRWAVRLEANIR